MNNYEYYFLCEDTDITHNINMHTYNCRANSIEHAYGILCFNRPDLADRKMKVTKHWVEYSRPFIQSTEVEFIDRKCPVILPEWLRYENEPNWEKLEEIAEMNWEHNNGPELVDFKRLHKRQFFMEYYKDNVTLRYFIKDEEGLFLFPDGKFRTKQPLIPIAVFTYHEALEKVQELEGLK